MPARHAINCVQVKCSLTLDNEVQEIKFNDEVLVVEGQLNDWSQKKSIAFKSCDIDNPGKLVIKGRDWNTNNNCKMGGLLLHCSASDTTNPWHNFKSGIENWKDENGDDPCQNDLLFPAYGRTYPFIQDLNTLGAKKIWAPRQNVVLTGTPV